MYINYIIWILDLHPFSPGGLKKKSFKIQKRKLLLDSQNEFQIFRLQYKKSKILAFKVLY